MSFSTTRNIAGAMARDLGGSLQRGLSTNISSDGAVSVVSDQEGATVSVDSSKPGKLVFSEVLEDGSDGDSLTIAVAAPTPEKPKK